MSADAANDDADAIVNALIQSVGIKVRTERTERRLSRRELSEMSGVSQRYLAQLEGGEGNISIGLLKRIALSLKIPIELLITDEPVNRETVELISAYERAHPDVRSRILQWLHPASVREQKAMRLSLVGLRGAGKSTLGISLAESLGLPFIELNKEIEKKAGIPIGEIIALYGQEGYRQLEAEVLDHVIQSHEKLILAVAGGVVADEKTFNRLLARFHTVWIKASPLEHMERVRAQGDMRPMADNPEAMTQLREILKTREAQYKLADLTLDTTDKTLAESETDLHRLIQRHHLLSES